MNQTKKIKLALLTSLVMLSSKGSYAMEDSIEDIGNDPATSKATPALFSSRPLVSSTEEINQLNSQYYEEEFLPQIGDKFREILGSSVTNQNLSKMILGYSTSKSRPMDVSNELLKFSAIFAEMYIPPSLFKSPAFVQVSWRASQVIQTDNRDRVPVFVPVFVVGRGDNKTYTPDEGDITPALGSHNEAELKSRLDQLDTLLSDPKYTNFHDPAHYKTDIREAVLRLEQAHFDSCLLRIQQNKSLLEDFNVNDNLAFILKAFTLTPDQFDARLALIKQHKELLFSGGRYVSDTLRLSIDKIYRLAKSTHYRNYFDKIFLPQIADEFRKILKSELSNQKLSQMILGSTNDYSPEVVKGKLLTFSTIFEEIYTPPSFEKLHDVLSHSVADLPAVGTSSSASNN